MSLEVRIRRASDGTSSYLCDIEICEVVDIIPMLEQWSIQGEWPTMVGQFVVSPANRPSYFEVVIVDDDA